MSTTEFIVDLLHEILHIIIRGIPGSEYVTICLVPGNTTEAVKD
jgi:hypothetical protein